MRPGFVAYASVAVALAPLGCDDGLLDELPAPQPLAVCIAPDGGWNPAPDVELIEESLSGRVTDTGRGTPPDDCFTPPLVGWGVGTSEASWFRIEDDSSVWTVGVVMGGFAAPPIDTDVEVRFSHAHDGFGPAFGDFALTDPGGLRAWLGLGGDVGDLALPSVIEDIRRGKTVYRTNDGCGTWEAFELEVKTSTDVVTLEYGEAEGEDDAVHFHGGYKHDTGTKSACSDWFVAELSVGWRRD